MAADPPGYQHEATYTRDQVSAALNDACGLLNEVEPMEYSVTLRRQSLLDLMVNLTMSLLDGTASTIDEAIELNYSAAPDEVRSWIW